MNRQPLSGEEILARFVVVLHQPQDLVNVALVVRAMKNMGLSRLRLVEPAELDAWRIEGIAHDTEEIVAAAQVHDTLDSALAGVVHVAGTTARRRAVRRSWSSPDEVAAGLIERARLGDVAILLGREDRGLSNEDLDRCHEVICIPTAPDHPSLNLSHAAVLLFYEVRRAVEERAGLAARDLSAKPRDAAPPASADQLEAFFGAWEEAMGRIGLFQGRDATAKMRTFRGLFHRARPDRREARLLAAVAYRIIHYTRRVAARAGERMAGRRRGAEDGRA